jgi:mycothiol synthase
MEKPPMITEPILDHDIPLPGVTFRGFAGEADFPRMARVLNASAAADRLDRVVTAEEITRSYAHLVNSDPYRDMVLVEVNGELAAYGRAWWQREENGPWLYAHLSFIAPEGRGAGLEPGLLARLERRLREIAAAHPEAEGSPRFFQAETMETQADYEALLRAAGYNPVRYGLSMVRPLDEPITVSPIPAGLEIHPAGPQHYRAVFDSMAEAFRDHWGYVAPEEVHYQGWLNGPEFQPRLWQIGWDTQTGQVAGTVLNFVNETENQTFQRRRGYTEDITVGRPWRRRGLAHALLTRSLQMFKDMGMSEAALGVDTENPNGALHLYESVGFRPRRRNIVHRRPL